MTNGQRAMEIIKKYGFDFSHIPKQEIIDLIEKEIVSYQPGSSEYIRLLCGYLYCLGDRSDIPLLEKAKYNINMDVGCMIDREWIDRRVFSKSKMQHKERRILSNASFFMPK